MTHVGQAPMTRVRYWRLFGAAAAASCVANATWWMQPLLLQTLSVGRGMGDTKGGIVISAEMSAMAVASVLAARLAVGRRLLPTALAGILLAIAGSVASLQFEGLWATLALRLVAGAGAGLCLAMMNAVAARLPDPDRVFASLSIANIVFGMTSVSGMNWLIGLDPQATPFTMLALGLTCMLPILALLPGDVTLNASADTAEPARIGPGGSVRVAMFLLALVSFAIGVGSGMTWMFYAQIGGAAGLSMDQIANAISIAIFGTLIATAAGSVLGLRLGRLLPAGFGLAMLALSISTLTLSPGPIMFHLAAIGQVSSVYFLMPYMFGAAAALDESGQGAIFVGSAFYATGSVGPGIGGWLADHTGIAFLSGLIVTAAIAAFAVLVWLERSFLRSSTPR